MDTDLPPSIGIIISTYNQPKWLEKTFWGYLNQSLKADEIIIADDGSAEETRLLIEHYSQLLPITHVWQEDNGFQKCKILNKALLASKADYLIFTDQDCIPREDFIETHIKYAEKGYFLSGGYFRLNNEISSLISQADVESREAFSLKWLRSKGMPINFKCTKLLRNTYFSAFMNHITPAGATWNGCNASGWRKDLLRIKGFNEQMQYGGQDREFGERLFNLGIKAKQLRYSAILLHLFHSRPYKTKESVEKNINIRKETRKRGIVETPFGLK